MSMAPLQRTGLPESLRLQPSLPKPFFPVPWHSVWLLCKAKLPAAHSSSLGVSGPILCTSNFILVSASQRTKTDPRVSLEKDKIRCGKGLYREAPCTQSGPQGLPAPCSLLSVLYLPIPPLSHRIPAASEDMHCQYPKRWHGLSDLQSYYRGHSPRYRKWEEDEGQSTQRLGTLGPLPSLNP